MTTESPAADPAVEARKLALRGSPSRTTEFMEAFQRGYLQGVLASAGCNLWRADIDEGIDALISHTSDEHRGKDKRVYLEIQLKATSRAPTSEFASAEMRRERYNEFAIEDPSINRIVVILHMPELQMDWCDAKPSGFTMNYCAYWVNLAGNDATTSDRKIVNAPTSQVFDDVALCEIMRRVGQGGKP